MFKRGRNKIILAVLLTGLAVAVSTIYGVYRSPTVNMDTIDDFREITSKDRILIFAPHCDDEVLGAGGLIQRAISKKASVRVVLITNGDNNIFSTDIEFKTMFPTAQKFILAGEARQKETVSAMMTLGLPFRDIIFFSYPDRGLKAMYTTNWQDDNPYRSRATHETKSVYRMTYDPNAVYSGWHLLSNIKEVFNEFHPTIVISPHDGDKHPDHRYAFKFIVMALKEIYHGDETSPSFKPILYTYLVHAKNFPRPEGFRTKDYLMLPLTASFDLHWQKFMMTHDEEAKKLDAIKEYPSQLRVPELKKLMNSFVRKNELFEETEY